MNTISIQASRNYNVIIGNNLLTNLDKHLLAIMKKPCKAVIVSDSNVWPIYGAKAENSLENAGFQVAHYTFPAGEASKNGDTFLSVLNFLAKNRLSRADAVIALGGGVVGDLTGFTAATYLRGIPYIQIPTSLLAMVDSSVGGKTAIDLPAGKNLAGAFYQPSLVLCDLDCLDTLPKSVFCDGCAEVIKYSVLYDENLFSHLAEFGLQFDRKTVISRCVELKRNVVAQDEFDTGARQKLNLGHTIGHGIEAQSNFTVTHGQAVAIGMAVVTKSACPEIYPQLKAVLELFQLPTSAEFTAKALCESALSDKKRSGDTVNLIIPRKIGDCEIVPTKVTQLEAFIEKGL